MHATLATSAVLLILLASACRTAPPPDRAGAPDAATASAGRVGVEVLRPVDDGAADRVGDERITRVAPSPMASNRLPAWPGDAFAAGVAGASVAVRIVVAADGSVASIGQSHLADSTGGPWADAFRQAVTDAVRTWRFHPATVTRSRPGPDRDGDGTADWEVASGIEPIAVELHRLFRFRRVDGEPSVTSSAG